MFLWVEDRIFLQELVFSFFFGRKLHFLGGRFGYFLVFSAREGERRVQGARGGGSIFY